MALFGKLFEKKSCSICGEEIGLLGNRKLADGNCCKKCAAKLSPWFGERKTSTVEQIREQLDYRARNAEELKSFNVTKVIGEYGKIYIEEVEGIPTRFFVTYETDYLDENPDIIPFENVMSCTVDIEDNDEELLREGKDGEMVSYNPPRFQHHYNFFIDMVIRNTPWFETVRFNVNDEDVTIEIVKGYAGSSAKDAVTLREEKRYRAYEQMCENICQAVERSRCGVQAKTAEESAVPAFCPACGAPNDGSRFCQFCGSKLS